MRTVTVYQIWSMISLTSGEEPSPLFMEYESESYLKVHEEFRKKFDAGDLCAIFIDTRTIQDPEDKGKMIYESPDGGKTIYVREFGSNLKRLLDDDEADRMRGLIKIK